MISGYHDLTETLAIVGNVVWQQWSQFGKPNLEDVDDQPQCHRRP
jgi:long-subunit fatty acid transport protein